MSTPPPGGPPPPPWGPHNGPPEPPSGGHPQPGGYQQGGGYGPPSGYSQGGYQQGGYPGGPTPPPQKKSRLGPVLAVLAVMVVLVGVGLGVGLLVLGNDDDDEPTTDPTPGETTSESSSSPSPTESTSPSPTETTPTETVPPGPRFDGTGYSYPQLDEWNDVTKDVKKQNPALVSIDTVAAWGKSITAGRANIIVEATSSFGSEDPQDLRKDWEAGIAAGTGADPSRIDAPDIADEEALGVELRRTNEGGVEIVQTAYLTVHDGTAYSITYSRTDADPDAQDAFGEMIDGWYWTS